MSDCPHIHVQDSGLQAFRDFIREETGNGQTIARFLNDAVEGRLSDFEPQHRLKAAKMLKEYGSEKADEYVRSYNAPKRRRSTAAAGSPGQREADGPDPIIDPLKDEMARFIREETDNGRTIVRNLIQMMETHEHPYKPHHNLDAARQLTDYGFPVTGDLLCAPECTHHTPAHTDTVEGDGASDSTEEEFVPDPAWIETLHEIKRMEDEGIIPKVEYDPFNPKSRMTGTEEEIAPYADEVAAKYRAELDLQAERRAKWPEIEERRRKKLAQIYPSHSEDAPKDPPDT